jgi:hypothetical protein
MSEETKDCAKDVPLKVLSKDLLSRQIKAAEDSVKQAQDQIAYLQNQIQQNIGIIGLSKHLLTGFILPEKDIVEEKKTELEVK